MIAAYHHGRTLDVERLRRSFGVSSRGVRLSDLMKAGQSLELTATAFHAAADALPLLTLPALLHWRGNHFVVLVEVAKSHAVIHDPAGGRRRISRRVLEDEFAGTAVEFRPTGGTLPSSWFALDTGGRSPRLRAWPAAAAAAAIEAALVYLVCLLAGSVFNALLQSSLGEMSEASVALALVGVLLTTLKCIAAPLMTEQLVSRVVPEAMKGAIGLDHERAARFDRVTLSQSLAPAATIWWHRYIEPIRGGSALGGAAAAAVIACTISAPAALVIIGLIAIGLALAEAVRALLRRSRQWRRRRRSAEAAFRTGVAHGDAIAAMGLSHEFQEAWLKSYLSERGTRILASASRSLSRALSVCAALLLVACQFLIAREAQLEPPRVAQLSLASFILAWRGWATITHWLSAADYAKVSQSLPSFEAAPTLPNAQRPSAPMQLRAEAVRFRYGASEDDVLAGITLKIEPGELVVVTGAPGSGKSTLLKVISGMLSPAAGHVLVGGGDLTSAERAQWRQGVGIVAITDPIIAGTIAENIALFDPSPDIQRLVRAVERAGFADRVAKFPMRLETNLAAGGVDLSQLEREQVLLARGFYRAEHALLVDGLSGPVLRKALRYGLGTESRLTRIVASAEAMELGADLVVHLKAGRASVGRRRELPSAVS